jgi:hypothetical protein
MDMDMVVHGGRTVPRGLDMDTGGGTAGRQEFEISGQLLAAGRRLIWVTSVQCRVQVQWWCGPRCRARGPWAAPEGGDRQGRGADRNNRYRRPGPDRPATKTEIWFIWIRDR